MHNTTILTFISVAEELLKSMGQMKNPYLTAFEVALSDADLRFSLKLTVFLTWRRK